MHQHKQQQQFTDTVNLRMLASELKRAGHTIVPDDVAILERTARKLGILSWMEDRRAKSDANFVALLAYHMTNESC